MSLTRTYESTRAQLQTKFDAAGTYPLKAMLVTGYVYNEGHAFVDDITTEITTGSVTRLTLSSITSTVTDGVWIGDAADPTWTGVTFTDADAIIVFADEGADSASPVLGCIDFAPTDVTAGDFTVTFAATGLFRVSADTQTAFTPIAPLALGGDDGDELALLIDGVTLTVEGGVLTAPAPEPVLLHHSFRRVEDGTAAGTTNGEGLLGAITLSDAAVAQPLVYQPAVVADGVLQLADDTLHVAAVTFADAILGSAPEGRGGVMFGGYAAATVPSECDADAIVTVGVTTAIGNGYAVRVATTYDGVSAVDSTIDLGIVASGAWSSTLDTAALPRVLAAGDTIEIRCVDSSGTAVLAGFWNGAEMVSATDATTDPATFATGAVRLDNDALANQAKWRPSVTDVWLTDGLAWWPGSLPSAASGGTGDMVGPASATANRIFVADGTTGKLAKMPSTDIDAGTQKITGVVNPTSAQHAATKDYVDTADALKAPLASPTFTGTPAAPTPSAADNSTKLATTAYVDRAVPVEPDPMVGYTGNGYGYFVPGGLVLGSNAGAVVSVNRNQNELWTFDEDMTIVPAMEWAAASAAGKLARLWVCSVTAGTWQPVAVVHDFGTIATDSAANTATEWASHTFTRGNYLARWVTDGGATFKGVTTIPRGAAIGGSSSSASTIVWPNEGASSSGAVSATNTTAFTYVALTTQPNHRIKVRRV